MVYGVISRKYYAHKSNKHVFAAYLSSYAEDSEKLIAGEQGFSDGNGNTWYLCFIGVLGDWPWLAKAGQLKASFYNCEKSTTNVSRPMCHLCLAGSDGMPWEDTSLLAAYIKTMGDREEPWDAPGPFLLLIRYIGNRELAYLPDGWHCFHLGAGLVFVGSGCVDALDVLPPGNAENKIDYLNSELDQFLKAARDAGDTKQLHFRGLTRELLGWKSNNQWPCGHWSKASDTVVMLLFLIHLLQKYKHSLDPILELVLEAAVAINFFWTEAYSHGYWIDASQGLPLAYAGITFLQINSRIVALSLARGRCRYMQMPKLHLLFHIFHRMYVECQTCGFCTNPIAETVQMNEDCVGQVSRASRKVSQRLMSKRTLEALLLRMREDWQKPFIFGQC
jgi:hypothetical protein